MTKSKIIYISHTHCKYCAPVVTQTKVGPCLVFKRQKEDETKPHFVTIDLVPVYPIRDKSLLDVFK